jgi:diguanylate cyclase (GGDEF)-like protein
MHNKTSNLTKVFAFKSKLTVITNLSIFEEKLNKELNKSTRESKGLAILFFDLDNFNNTNDILSFDYNDEFLEIISEKFEPFVTNKGTIYRCCENKFLLAIYGIENVCLFKKSIKNMLKNLNQLIFDESDIYNSTNVGISIYPNHGYTTKELINKAKIAMYKSKELGINKYCFFENNIYNEMVEKKEMEKDLRHALKNNEFVIHYQPQIDIQMNKVYGVEALLRWNSHKRGYMPPAKFIPLAEESGLIIEIGEWVLRQACIQAKKWQELGINIKMSINISAIQLQDKDFLDIVKKILNETNVNPSLIDFEITESILIKSMKEAQMILTELKDMGVKISLDDFGTGYSSLIYLNNFPIDTIKIDKSFIQQIFTCSTKTAIIEGIIYIAQNIGMDFIAEGIENKEELKFLKCKNCNKVQGYLFSKPLPINEIEVFFSEFNENLILLK